MLVPDESISSSPRKKNRSIHESRRRRRSKRGLEDIYWPDDCNGLTSSRGESSHCVDTNFHQMQDVQMLALADRCAPKGVDETFRAEKLQQLAVMGFQNQSLKSVESSFGNDLNSTKTRANELTVSFEITDSELNFACAELEKASKSVNGNMIFGNMCSTPVAGKEHRLPESLSKEYARTPHPESITKLEQIQEVGGTSCQTDFTNSRMPACRKKMTYDHITTLSEENAGTTQSNESSKPMSVIKSGSLTQCRSEFPVKDNNVEWNDDWNFFVNFKTQDLVKSFTIPNETDTVANFSVEAAEEVEKSRPLPGFQMASRRVVKISEQALKRAMELLHNSEEKLEVPIQSDSKLVPMSTSQDNTTHYIDPEEFSIASKALKRLSCDNIEKELKDVDVVHNNDGSYYQNKFAGFQTASNKRIKVSESAKFRAANMLAELSEILVTENGHMQDLETSLKKAKQSVKEMCGEKHLINSKEKTFPMRTANTTTNTTMLSQSFGIDILGRSSLRNKRGSPLQTPLLKKCADFTPTHSQSASPKSTILRDSNKSLNSCNTKTTLSVRNPKSGNNTSASHILRSNSNCRPSGLRRPVTSDNNSARK